MYQLPYTIKIPKLLVKRLYNELPDALSNVEDLDVFMTLTENVSDADLKSFIPEQYSINVTLDQELISTLGVIRELENAPHLAHALRVASLLPEPFNREVSHELELVCLMEGLKPNSKWAKLPDLSYRKGLPGKTAEYADEYLLWEGIENGLGYKDLFREYINTRFYWSRFEPLFTNPRFEEEKEYNMITPEVRRWVSKIARPTIDTILSKPTPKPLVDALEEFTSLPLKDYVQFRGKTSHSNAWLKYLEQIFGKSGQTKVRFWSQDNVDCNLIYSASKNTLESKCATKSIKKILPENPDFIIGLMTLQLRGGNHANAIILDVSKKLVTRFEPHGKVSGAYSQSSLDSLMKRWVRRNLPPEWKYLAPINFCPRIGPQRRDKKVDFERKRIKVYGRSVLAEAKGFCQAWSMYYIHFRVSNPSMTDKEAIEYISNWSDQELSKRIRQYAEYIVSKVSSQKLAEEKKKILSVEDRVSSVFAFRTKRITLTGTVKKIKRVNASVEIDPEFVGKKVGRATIAKRYLIPLAELSLIEK